MIKDILKNLALLILILFGLLVAFPGLMSQVFGLLGTLFGPLLIVIIVMAALPRRKRKRW